MVHFREIKKNELHFLRDMLYEALFVPVGQPPFPKSVIDEPEIAKYIKDWNQWSNDLAIVAIHNNVLIGAIWGRCFCLENKGYGFVGEDIPEISMAVQKEFRSQGIGTNLLRSIEKEYLKKGVEKLSLSVDKQNFAKEFYTRNNYNFYEEAGTAVTLLKSI